MRELHDKGLNTVEIAKECGATKSAISKVLRQMGREVTTAAVQAAPEYVEKKQTATEHLLFLVGKMKDELTWLESEVPRQTDQEYRAWQAQKIAFSGEMRKLITAVADIGYKLFQANEVAEIFAIIDEEIGRESVECQARIRERIQRRRNIRFPGGTN
ncbi:MAG TPA: hypothetical protein PLQ15_00835 [Syntrophales bacterium]|nr:hypothetical protein [Syntrophales bacterium]